MGLIRHHIVFRILLVLLILPVSIKPVIAMDLTEKPKITEDIIYKMNPFNNDFNVSSDTEQKSHFQIVLPLKIIASSSQECLLRFIKQQRILTLQGKNKKHRQKCSILDNICVLQI
jgi:hypothetical protein